MDHNYEVEQPDYYETVEETDDAADASGAVSLKCGKRFRFRSCHDLALLRQVVEIQPFLAEHGKQDECWGKVASTLIENSEVPVGVTSRAIRDRLHALVKYFETNNWKKIQSSGDDTEFIEKKQLLSEVMELIKINAERKESRCRRRYEGVIAKQAQSLKFVDKKRQYPGLAGNGSDDGVASDQGESSKRLKDDYWQVMKERRLEREVANERLRLQLEDKKVELDRERLRLENERADKAAELERERLRIESEKVSFDRLRFESEMKEREERRKLDQKEREEQRIMDQKEREELRKMQMEITRFQLEFVANLTSKFSQKSPDLNVSQ